MHLRRIVGCRFAPPSLHQAAFSVLSEKQFWLPAALHHTLAHMSPALVKENNSAFGDRADKRSGALVQLNPSDGAKTGSVYDRIFLSHWCFVDTLCSDSSPLQGYYCRKEAF